MVVYSKTTLRNILRRECLDSFGRESDKIEKEVFTYMGLIYLLLHLNSPPLPKADGYLSPEHIQFPPLYVHLFYH